MSTASTVLAQYHPTANSTLHLCMPGRARRARYICGYDGKVVLHRSWHAKCV